MNATRPSCPTTSGAIDGNPEGVRQRAAAEMIQTGRACRKFMDLKPGEKHAFPALVNGFTGSSIWHSLDGFPPTSQDYWNAGFKDFADRFGPILDAFEAADVNVGLEVHPTEIACDLASAQRAVEAVGGHKRFGFNYDPSHLGHQGVGYVKFLRELAGRIHHVHMKDAWWGHGDGSVGVFGGHTRFADPRRYLDFRSVGRGDIQFEDIMVALNDINYSGPLSVEWEDTRMDRFFGGAQSCADVRSIEFPRNPALAFDAAFDRANQKGDMGWFYMFKKNARRRLPAGMRVVERGRVGEAPLINARARRQCRLHGRHAPVPARDRSAL